MSVYTCIRKVLRLAILRRDFWFPFILKQRICNTQAAYCVILRQPVQLIFIEIRSLTLETTKFPIEFINFTINRQIIIPRENSKTYYQK